MFSTSDMVVYPGYGIARVDGMIEKTLGGSVTQLIKLCFIGKNTMVLVPVVSVMSVGLRHLANKETVEGILDMLEQQGDNMSCVPANWNKRNKEYQAKVARGDLCEIAEVYRDLTCLSRKKELSFAENGLYQKVEALLVEEIAAVRGVDSGRVTEYLYSICKRFGHSHNTVQAVV